MLAEVGASRLRSGAILVEQGMPRKETERHLVERGVTNNNQHIPWHNRSVECLLRSDFAVGLGNLERTAPAYRGDSLSTGRRPAS